MRTGTADTNTTARPNKETQTANTIKGKKEEKNYTRENGRQPKQRQRQ